MDLMCEYALSFATTLTAKRLASVENVRFGNIQLFNFQFSTGKYPRLDGLIISELFLNKLN